MNQVCEECTEIKKIGFQIDDLELVLQKQKLDIDGVYEDFLVLMERYGSISASKRELIKEAEELPEQTEAKIQEVKKYLRETGRLHDYFL